MKILRFSILILLLLSFMQESLSASKSEEEVDFKRTGLSIDGGGMRGLLPAIMMRTIELNTGSRIHELFDYVGGTSTGGILALGSVAAHEGEDQPVVTMDELVNFYITKGADIFSPTWAVKQVERYEEEKKEVLSTRRAFRTVFGFTLGALTNSTYVPVYESAERAYDTLHKNKYSPHLLEALLSEILGDAKLSDSLTNVVIPTVHHSPPHTPCIFDTCSARKNSEDDFYMKDIARATSAAPTYFPAAIIKNVSERRKLTLIDGGMAVNNPARLVYDRLYRLCRQEENDPDNIFLVSLGTGMTVPQSVAPVEGGIFHWAKPSADAFILSNSLLIDQELETLLTKEKYKRFQPQYNFKADMDDFNEKVLDGYNDVADRLRDQLEPVCIKLKENQDLRRQGET